MSNISMVEARLPPGFRFHPRDDELVCDYLMRKVSDSDSPLLIEVDLNKCEPWDIPEVARVGGKEWYFYSQRDRKYATGLRTNRATASGYWKATGKDRAVLRKDTLVGMRKTLVFYLGRAPRGRKTEWVMHEFRIEGPPPPPLLKEDWVLCRVFHKSRDVPAGADATSDFVGGFCHDSSPSFPDSFIAFGQSHSANAYEQVPCFSILSQSQSQSQSQASPIFIGQTEPCNVAAGNDISADGMFGDWEDLSCHKREVLKAVMNRITKAEIIGADFSLSPSLEGSSESYLSEVVMPNIWNNI